MIESKFHECIFTPINDRASKLIDALYIRNFIGLVKTRLVYEINHDEKNDTSEMSIFITKARFWWIYNKKDKFRSYHLVTTVSI